MEVKIGIDTKSRLPIFANMPKTLKLPSFTALVYRLKKLTCILSEAISIKMYLYVRYLLLLFVPK